ncbi:Fatty acid oxidation complex subunit alpha [Posidoniimonas corsicana]|uniref:enoyl-CoA hydratase n=1 Tax=Posidoniimonas corsicana TaxID=1938618 RepID=A0A5C5VHI5_9BACT|nr:3-hydroxyacyl-CoA dehydrogenase NAD-binding domain-containing protein [Posidoniimonas corsicana]TWT37205.1 Fatty acid oxidation complex subunit alpha [Posidoniimonas corsicana]
MSGSSHTSLAVHDDGLAVITLDRQGSSANLLSSGVLDEIEGHLNALDKRSGVSGLVFVSAKSGIFIAGADLTEFAAGLDQSDEEVQRVSQRGQQLLGRLATCGYVTVAAIDGICVGGGAELAVWCDRRILTTSSKTQFGFPEVKLGLFPGWGGTARTPRMIGLSNAVELVTGGESVGAHEAAKLGLAEDLVSDAEGLIDAARRMVAAESDSGDYLADRKAWSDPITIDPTELGFLGATASAYIQGQTGGHYPAPLAALELMLEASQVDLEAACEMESQRFAPLFGSPVNRSLLNVFFLQDRAKKTDVGSRQSPDESSEHWQHARRVSVIGAGIMGQGIAAANVKRGIAVSMSDMREESLLAGISGVVREASYNKQTKSVDAELAIERSALVDAALSDAELGWADIVIEAVVENLEVKHQLFERLERHLGERTILCSNTSTIPISQLAEGLAHPDRFCGLHFFNPVRKMPLVEVIRGKRTSEATIAAMAYYARRLGKTPVIVNDGPGFLVNRLLLPYMNEAALLVSEGVPIKDVERAAKDFGMPMGPITLYDVVGLDTCLHAGGVMLEAFPDRVVPATIVERLVEAGRLGQKNGRGFFDYPSAKPGKPPKGVPSDEAAKLIDEDRRRAEVDAPIVDRLMLPMLLEATRAVEDGVAADVRDVDLALILGIGFPPHKGGLFHWADTIGAAAILERLKPLEPLGERFRPTALLTQVAADGGKFYDLSHSTGGEKETIL